VAGSLNTVMNLWVPKKFPGISLVDERLLASQEGIRFVELIGIYYNVILRCKIRVYSSV
jgi:hypothetical protein